MSHSESLEKLIGEAGHLRDHLLRVEGQDGVELGVALQPFERDNGPDNIDDSNVAALSGAFQKAYDGALKSVDGYTLNEVLKGRSPHMHRASVLGSVILTAIGVLFVAAAFHFSSWSNRTSFILGQAERFIEFNHFESITKLIELENYFQQVTDAPDSSGLEPQLVYLEGLSTLKNHYYEEITLPSKMFELRADLNPIKKWWDNTKLDFCSEPNPQIRAERSKFLNWAVYCAPPSPQPVAVETEADLTEDDPTLSSSEELSQPDADVSTLVSAKLTPNAEPALAPRGSYFKLKIDEIEELQKATMTTAGRVPVNPYVNSRNLVRFQIQSLTERLNIVYLWALPIIYGSLGSIVYCMWRVLNPNLAPLGALYTIMRTAFAGLAALTLSMLLVPTNILTVGVDLNRPIIYLLSFIFGYSIEAFVSTLNVLNTYLSTNLTPKPRRS